LKSAIVVVFGLTSFLASVLLFSVEPMIGKMVLPVFGGTPSVWNTCLVYFQMMLLCGYLLALGVDRAKEVEPHRVSIVTLLTVAALLAAGWFLQPIALQADVGRPISSNKSPAVALLGILFLSAALPLVMVSAITPLVQHWFALTGHPRAHDPYFLYAASNSGSLLALLAYPFLIEPNLGLAAQSRIWRTGFLIMAVLVLTCGVAAWRRGRFDPEIGIGTIRASDASSRSLSLATWLRWLILVFVPSSWLMGVTSFLTTDLAAIPLLWTIPLALYLFSFILAFAQSTAGVVFSATRVLPFVVVPLVLVMSAGFTHAAWVPLHLLAFFVGSVACHGALNQLRPLARYARTFYVTIAIGGLLGGIFNALVAPIVFDRVIEYPLAVVLACLIAPATNSGLSRFMLKEWLGDLLIPGVVFLLTAVLATNQAGLADSVVGVFAVMVASGLGLYSCVTAQRHPLRFALVALSVLAASGLGPGVNGWPLHIERNFFGVARVTRDAEQNVHRLFHGSTLHGQQSFEPDLRREPSTYFTHSGPIGQVFAAIKPRLEPPSERVAIVGLGTGTLATYARSGQRWTFYEIDDAVVRIANDPRYFTYLGDCEADAMEIVLGDARLRLHDAADQVYRLIVLDAFSSGAVPVHLISREAIQLYRSKLENGGMLAFHLSNHYLDLDPIMARQADDSGLVYRVRYDLNLSDEDKRSGKQASIWAVMAATKRDLGALADDPRWQATNPRPGSAAWTDDYSDPASYLLLTPGRLWRRSRPPGITPRRD
jgi:hypothetical protein